MCALPPKADMCGAVADVRFGPEADSCTAAKSYLVTSSARAKYCQTIPKSIYLAAMCPVGLVRSQYATRGENPAIFWRGIRCSLCYLGPSACVRSRSDGSAGWGANQGRLRDGAYGRARRQRQVRPARPENLGGGYQCQRRAARPSGEAHLL